MPTAPQHIPGTKATSGVQVVLDITQQALDILPGGDGLVQLFLLVSQFT